MLSLFAFFKTSPVSFTSLINTFVLLSTFKNVYIYVPYLASIPLLYDYFCHISLMATLRHSSLANRKARFNKTWHGRVIRHLPRVDQTSTRYKPLF